MINIINENNYTHFRSVARTVAQASPMPLPVVACRGAIEISEVARPNSLRPLGQLTKVGAFTDTHHIYL